MCARWLAAVVAVAGLVVVALPAHATPRAAAATDVTLKGGLNDPKDPNIAVLEFLPETVKVATGTTVTWEIAGPEPHSVTFVPPGTTVPPSIETDPSLTFPTPATASVRRHDARELGRAAPRRDLGGAEVLDVVRARPARTPTTACCTRTWSARVTVTGDTQDSQQKITKAGNAGEGQVPRRRARRRRRSC